jgi:cyclopropane fatty-acyl-phospholipid synthase-like methyltransferase
LAKRGYALTAVDLSAALIEECRMGLAAEGPEAQVRLVVADARDLGAVAEKGFDAVLLMGPLDHLAEEADRKAVMRRRHPILVLPQSLWHNRRFAQERSGLD